MKPTAVSEFDFEFINHIQRERDRQRERERERERKERNRESNACKRVVFLLTAQLVRRVKRLATTTQGSPPRKAS